jgi:phosphodiesterase/alkaline phosphatase D-like protein
MSEYKIALGPLLGVESDTTYTVCVLLNAPFEDGIPELRMASGTIMAQPINGDLPYKEIGFKDKFRFYRFEFDVENNTAESKDITYQLVLNGAPIANRHQKDKWQYFVCPQGVCPEVAFVSCNGNHGLYPTEIDPSDFKGWEKMNDEKPDFLVMTGDQIYADTLWEKVAGIQDFVEGKTKKIDEEALEDFYIQLYIDSWANESMALALAQIPNIMTWDDHDIIDGYGSYGKPYRNTLKSVFAKAKIYFELFQVRTTFNKALINKKYDYSICLKVRNYAFILPDTRSHRDEYNVMDHKQYLAIANAVIHQNKLNITTAKDIVCFVLPVPIAYRDFSNILEKGVFYIHDRLRKFTKSGSDDLIDHWDHNYHKAEQKVMLDFIFEIGEIYNPKNLLIVSGDVHSSGAARITQHRKYNEQRFATQLVSSPMVNDSSGFMDKAKNFISEDFKVVDNYSCNLLHFGDYPDKDFYHRNFMILKKVQDIKVVAHIFMETKQGWTGEYNGQNITRTLNDYIKPEYVKQ